MLKVLDEPCTVSIEMGAVKIHSSSHIIEIVRQIVYRTVVQMTPRPNRQSKDQNGFPLKLFFKQFLPEEILLEQKG